MSQSERECIIWLEGYKEGAGGRIDTLESKLEALKKCHNTTCESVTNNQINFIKRIIALEEQQKESDAIIKAWNATEEK